MRSRSVVEVHDYLAEREEFVDRHGFGEEVGGVDRCADKWHHELTVFDHVAHVEVGRLICFERAWNSGL